MAEDFDADVSDRRPIVVGGIRQFGHLSEEAIDEVFVRPPVEVGWHASRTLLADRLGATLYTPATRPALVDDIAAAERAGTVSMVLDLEDSVEESMAGAAEDRLVESLAALWLKQSGREPLRLALFVRVRTIQGIGRLFDRLGSSAQVLAGIVVPKFSAVRAEECFETVRQAGDAAGRRLYVMPVVETAEFLRADLRVPALAEFRAAVEPYRDDVLTVRIGGTDLAGLYGLRRTPDLTIYDVQLVSAALGDIVNMLGDPRTGYPVSGPVWEHFAPRERVLRPQLRSTPFVDHDAVAVRERLLLDYYDGLISEVLLDRANGMTGKSVIHPDQAAIVNALSVVTDEEYQDAHQIAASEATGGASASGYRNKMNESKPHAVWAERTLRRADAFGVARPGHGYIDILAARGRS